MQNEYDAELAAPAPNEQTREVAEMDERAAESESSCEEIDAIRKETEERHRKQLDNMLSGAGEDEEHTAIIGIFKRTLGDKVDEWLGQSSVHQQSTI